MNDRIKQLLRELGSAINDSISNSDDVSRHIQKIRNEGYELYVVLDAKIGLNKQDGTSGGRSAEPVAAVSESDVQFRINVNDLALLRAIGIDPTRKVKSARRIELLPQTSDDE